ncbi:Phospholipid:diacylglycerol acyltransferase 1 [Castilleja foliolosa]|uniref:Phospholipid:diacylglycerol acyltransferase 1 n=1 Tax=Castilleja foliolosa TaxID=1961234 RepID=A0ABD3E9I0_9LAMI
MSQATGPSLSAAVLVERGYVIRYEEKNMYMDAYDWRLSFQNTEVRLCKICSDL